MVVRRSPEVVALRPRSRLRTCESTIHAPPLALACARLILDTETTGLDPKQGHRIIEIAGVELVDRRPTGRHVHF